MLTVYDCALLSEAAYSGNSLRPVLSRGFKLKELGWDLGRGFFARAFFRKGLVVVAFAGTDDLEDLLDNREFLRNIPKEQAGQATRYLNHAHSFASPDDTFVVTGHSLGGGLAKHVFLQDEFYRAPPLLARATGHEFLKNRMPSAAVAFNAPYVGGLDGVKNREGTLLNVNTLGDPVSGITKKLGRSSLGEDVDVNVPPPTRLGRVIASAVSPMLGEFVYTKYHFHSIAPLIAALATSKKGEKTVVP